MAVRPRLDLRRLARDAAAAPGAHRVLRAPGGRDVTGLMQAVRDNLDALIALQASGLTWDAVAAGLSAQGFTTADGRAITGRNLTGIISSVRRQGANRIATRAARANRSDRPGPTAPLESLNSPRAFQLAPELRQGRETLATAVKGSSEDAPPTEAEIRQHQADKHRHLFKKD